MEANKDKSKKRRDNLLSYSFLDLPPPGLGLGLGFGVRAKVRVRHPPSPPFVCAFAVKLDGFVYQSFSNFWLSCICTYFPPIRNVSTFSFYLKLETCRSFHRKTVTCCSSQLAIPPCIPLLRKPDEQTKVTRGRRKRRPDRTRQHNTTQTPTLTQHNKTQHNTRDKRRQRD